MHSIIWTDKTREEIKDRWQNGIIWVGEYVNQKTINYIIKYVHKIDKNHKEFTPKVLCSAGIGGEYIKRSDIEKNKYKANKTKESYTFKNGTEASLPIYYRNKIYTEEEREKLWIEKLDKEERWIMGKKYSVKNKTEMEKFLKKQAYEQKENERRGYGTYRDWETNKNIEAIGEQLEALKKETKDAIIESTVS